MNLRQITIKDQLELKKVYFDSIQSLDEKIYSQEQKRAWSSQAWNNPNFDNSIIKGKGWLISKQGIIMSGVSAGAICWFDKGITDSYAKELTIIDCLGIVEGIACPHFDEEKEREPYVNDVIHREIIESCICIEGNCALHIKNDFEYSSIDFGKGKKCYKVLKENNNLKKEII